MDDGQPWNVLVLYTPRQGEQGDSVLRDVPITTITTVAGLKTAIAQHDDFPVPADQQVLEQLNGPVLIDEDQVVSDLRTHVRGKFAAFMYHAIEPQALSYNVIFGQYNNENMGDLDEPLPYSIHSQSSVDYLKGIIGQRFGLSPHRMRLEFMGVEPRGTMRLDQLIVPDRTRLTFNLTELERNADRSTRATVAVVLENGQSKYLEMEREDTIANLAGYMNRSGYVSPGSFRLLIQRPDPEFLYGNQTIEQLHHDEQSIFYVQKE